MNEARRQAYLEAMEIPVWVARPEAGAPCVELSLAAGSGSTLLICRDSAESSSVIASDIGRALAGGSMWSWPAPEQDGSGTSLASAVQNELLTRVVIFGEQLAAVLFNGAVPPLVGSARIIVTTDLDELTLSPRHRRSLWRQLADLPGADSR